jgi:hypothetical protein
MVPVSIQELPFVAENIEMYKKTKSLITNKITVHAYKIK